MYTENSAQFGDTRFDIPTTEEEAFRILDEVYPLEEKQMARDKTKEEFAGDEHFSLGMWIRNNWIYRPEIDDPVLNQRYDACYAMLIGKEESSFPYRDPDDLSSDFLEKYHDHLKATCRVNQPVEEVRRKPAKCPHCGHKVLRILYGEPTEEAYQQSLQDKFILGGCCINEYSPDWQCPTCGQAFIKGPLTER